MDLNSIRKRFSKLLNKLHLNQRSVAFLPRMKKGKLVTVLWAAALMVGLTITVMAFGGIDPSFVIGSGGKVYLPSTVGFYWDRNCTSPVLFIDWGTIEPGLTSNVTVFVRNEGSQAISLNITAENWSPIETTTYMTFSIDYMGQTISPLETIQITLSLTTSPSLEGIISFSLDINVAINPV